jgi:hypothetical protein
VRVAHWVLASRVRVCRQPHLSRGHPPPTARQRLPWRPSLKDRYRQRRNPAVNPAPITRQIRPAQTNRRRSGRAARRGRDPATGTVRRTSRRHPVGDLHHGDWDESAVSLLPAPPARRRRLRRPDHTRLLAHREMTIRSRDCNVQVHALARVDTYSGIIAPCTCTCTNECPSRTVTTGRAPSRPAATAGAFAASAGPSRRTPPSHWPTPRCAPDVDRGWRIWSGLTRVELLVLSVLQLSPRTSTRHRPHPS